MQMDSRYLTDMPVGIPIQGNARNVVEINVTLVDG